MSCWSSSLCSDFRTVFSCRSLHFRDSSHCEWLLACSRALVYARASNYSPPVLDSVEPAKILLGDLFNRLMLKDQPFTTFSPSLQNAMDALWTNMHAIDSSLLTTDTTQKSIASRVGILDFMNSHCKATHYMFSVKKCGLQSCQCCRLPTLLTEVFSPLHHLPDQLLNLVDRNY